MTQPARLHWLESAWLRNLCAGALMLLVGLVGALYANSVHLGLQPFGTDFLTFWSASKLVLGGHAIDAYDLGKLVAAAAHAYPQFGPPGPWFYPPLFLLMVAPAALLPLWITNLVYAAAGTTLWVLALRRLLPYRYTMLWALTLPGVWYNFIQGQNGCLSTALAALALFYLPRRAVLAGVLIGLLAFKPHLAILFPVVLACGRHGRAFAAAAVTACVVSALPLLFFKADVYLAFLHGIGQARQMLEHGQLTLAQAVGVFASLRMRHMPLAPAYLIHFGLAALAVIAAAYVWRASREPGARVCVLVGATFMCSPYLYNYDALWFVLPIVFLDGQARSPGWLSAERAVLVFAWIYPALGLWLARHLNFSAGPFLSAALVGLGVRRVWSERRLVLAMPQRG